MKLMKIQKYLEKKHMDYTYRIIDNLASITIMDKSNNYIHITESENKIIFFWRLNNTDNTVKRFCKTQDEILKLFEIEKCNVKLKCNIDT